MITYTPCTCKKCRDKRPELPDRCPCEECQPGPGINFLARQSAKSQRHQIRLRALLEAPHLSDAEEKELDGLLHQYIHRTN